MVDELCFFELVRDHIQNPYQTNNCGRRGRYDFVGFGFETLFFTKCLKPGLRNCFRLLRPATTDVNFRRV